MSGIQQGPVTQKAGKPTEKITEQSKSIQTDTEVRISREGHETNYYYNISHAQRVNTHIKNKKRTQVKFLDIKTRKGGLLMIVTSFGIFFIPP